jgi:hypothetical protein
MAINKRIVLIVGEERTGKSRSLKTLRDPKTIAYANCDCKDLTFKDDFSYHEQFTDPADLMDFIDAVEDDEDIETIIIDTITYLMRSFKIHHIDKAVDGRNGWGLLQKYYNALMLKLKATHLNVIIIGHVYEYTDESTGAIKSKMDFQGSIARSPIGDFTTVLESKSHIVTKKLLKLANDTLTFDELAMRDGIKYTFLTRRTKAYSQSLVRSADDLWKTDQLFIDNDIQIVIDRLEEYYE